MSEEAHDHVKTGTRSRQKLACHRPRSACAPSCMSAQKLLEWFYRRLHNPHCMKTLRFLYSAVHLEKRKVCSEPRPVGHRLICAEEVGSTSAKRWRSRLPRSDIEATAYKSTAIVKPTPSAQRNEDGGPFRSTSRAPGMIRSSRRAGPLVAKPFSEADTSCE